MDPGKEANYTESTLLIESGRRYRRRNDTKIIQWSLKKKLVIIVSLVTLLAVAIAVAVTLGATLKHSTAQAARYYTHAAVATDAAPCSTIGVDILKSGGNAVDSAIASMLCVGVVNLQSTGIGGGGFLLLYNVTTGVSTIIDFRETAPSIISDDVMERYVADPVSTVKGGLAVAVPGQLKGLYHAWQKYGVLEWAELVAPAIKLASDGFKVTPPIASAIVAVSTDLPSYDGLRQLLQQDNGSLLTEGDVLKQPELADTLREIAAKGEQYFYNSSFTETMVNELVTQHDSILTVDDFTSYKVVEREVLVSECNGLWVHSAPPPASGAIVSLIMNIMEGYNIGNDDRGLTYHHLVEAMKFAYGQRLYLGDPDYNDTINEIAKYMIQTDTANSMRGRINDSTTYPPEYYMEREEFNPSSHGTAHLSVIDQDGNAVAMTTTINTYFGSLIRSTTSGVIFNNEMDDFSVPGRNNSYGYPPTPSNYIRAGFRPLSSTTPTIITDNNTVVFVGGASGGSRIPSSTVQVILDTLSFQEEVAMAVSSPRLHHQLLPDILELEQDFPIRYKEILESKGHTVETAKGGAVVQAIHVTGGRIYAASDPRKGGQPDGY